MVKEIDPFTWYSERQLQFTPKHFVVAKTPITHESKLWILQNLQGRFSLISNRAKDDTHPLLILSIADDIPAFEDPKEATMYELTWS